MDNTPCCAVGHHEELRTKPELWAACVQLKPWLVDDDGELLYVVELRNCPACGATLGIERYGAEAEAIAAATKQDTQRADFGGGDLPAARVM